MRIVTHFLTAAIRLTRRASFCRSESPSSNSTGITMKEGRTMLEKAKNSARRRGLQSRAWPIHDIVFGWYCGGRAVSDWASLAAGTCSAPWWWQWSWVVRRRREKRERERCVIERGWAKRDLGEC